MNWLVLTLFLLVIILLSAFITLASKRILKFWLLSPTILMLAYFLLVVFPGILLHESPTVMGLGLAGNAFWLCGVLGGTIFTGFVIPSRSHGPDTCQSFGNGTVMLFFVLISVPAVLITFFMLGRVPLFMGLGSLFFGDSDISMHTARRMNTLQHRKGDTVYFGQGYLRQIYTVVSPVFLTAFYIYKRELNQKASLLTIRLLMVFLVLAAALNGQIWISVNVIMLFAMGHFLFLLRASGGRNYLRLIKNGFVTYITLLGFVFAYRYLQYIGGREFDSFFLDTLRRIYIPGAIELFEIFPDEHPFRFGSTWLNDISGMLPGSVQSFAYEVHYLVHGGGWGFTLSPGIVASSYVNFGFPGVALTGFLFSLGFNVIFAKLTSSNSAIRLALALYTSIYFMLSMPGDIISFIVCLATAFLIYWTYVFFNSLKKMGPRRVKRRFKFAAGE